MKKIILLAFFATSTIGNCQKIFIVKSDEKFGLVNESGILLVPPKYNSIEEFDQSHVNWAKVELDNQFGFIDKTGKIVVDSKYEFIDSYNLHINGWAMVKKKWKVWIYK